MSQEWVLWSDKLEAREEQIYGPMGATSTWEAREEQIYGLRLRLHKLIQIENTAITLWIPKALAPLFNLAYCLWCN